MKTRCPGCETVFRVTPTQLKARAGKVRCGQCQSVFNALDSLLDELGALDDSATSHEAPLASPVPPPPTTTSASPTFNEHLKIDILLDAVDEDKVEPHESVEPVEDRPAPLSETAAQELGKATGLILPRETTEIPGYSKWSEGVVSTPFALPEEKSTRWPFVLAALLLVLGLVGQSIFHFRSEIAVALPTLRPLLETMCQALDVELPLPRHVELVSIETSDLQADPARGNLLVLNASLHNRASYGQAYPALELSLTDTGDAAIARRVFRPAEYLPQNAQDSKVFAANSEIVVRLWIEAKDISAAGYRLYVFYP